MTYKIGDKLQTKHNSQVCTIVDYQYPIYYLDDNYGYLDYELGEYFTNLSHYPKLVNLIGESKLLELLAKGGSPI